METAGLPEMFQIITPQRKKKVDVGHGKNLLEEEANGIGRM